jgi:hypothetical protein
LEISGSESILVQGRALCCEGDLGARRQQSSLVRLRREEKERKERRDN